MKAIHEKPRRRRRPVAEQEACFQCGAGVFEPLPPAPQRVRFFRCLNCKTVWQASHGCPSQETIWARAAEIRAERGDDVSPTEDDD